MARAGGDPRRDPSHEVPSARFERAPPSSARAPRSSRAGGRRPSFPPSDGGRRSIAPRRLDAHDRSCEVYHGEPRLREGADGPALHRYLQHFLRHAPEGVRAHGI